MVNVVFHYRNWRLRRVVTPHARLDRARAWAVLSCSCLSVAHSCCYHTMTGIMTPISGAKKRTCYFFDSGKYWDALP